MNELRPPRSRAGLREWLLALVTALFGYAYVGPLLRDWHIPGLMSVVLGLALSAALAVPFLQLLATRRPRNYTIVRRPRPLWLASWCAASLLLVQQVVFASGAEPLFGESLWWSLASGVIIWTGAYQYARDSQAALLDRVLEVGDSRHAAELVERCTRELGDGPLAGQRRTKVTLTLAGSLITLSGSPGHEDALPRAVTILEAELVVGEPPEAVFLAAAQTVTALRAKRRRTGDDVGYDRGLELMAEAARRAAGEMPAAPGLVEAAWAQRLADDAERGDEQASNLLAAAIERLDRAVAATPEQLPEHALHVAVRARLAGEHPLRGDLDRSIAECRAAVRRLRWLGSEHRSAARLALSDLLELRAVVAPDGGLGGAVERALPGLRRSRLLRGLWPKRAGNDLARATWLCFQVIADGGDAAAHARERLPRLREELVRRGGVSLPSALDRQTGWMYGHVAREQGAGGHGAAIEVCERWAAWSDARGDEDQAAEAWWCWVSAVGSDLRRRVLEGKDQRISQVQGLFAEAADRLVRVGRTREAVMALEMGRAVLLTERMHREHEGLEARLLEVGRTDLAQRWRCVIERIEEIDRAAIVDGSGIELAGLASAEYVALAEHEALLREIGGRPGFEDVDAAPEYDDMRLAAREGPIVYLAARETHGLALVVDGAAPEPRVIELPQMHRARIHAHLERVRAPIDPVDVAATMKRLLPTLWTEILEPLLVHVAPSALVTLIPIGGLAELPLHMAGVTRDGSGVWRDRTGGVVFRYSPNARVLLRAQRTADAVSDEELRLLTAAVPDVPGKAPLMHAAAESRGVAASFAPGRAARPDPATVASVVPLLDAATIWHFACHGTHNPEAPLESTLELSDGPLTARALLAGRRGRRRLAVLSACQTGVLGSALPDEVVGFSSALLQAGVAGVVSCQADVEDHAATILIVDFFARFAQESSPARALAASQAWLRSATNEEIHAAFPDVHPWTDDEREVERWRRYRPFADPSTWVLFNYTGA